MPNPFDGAARPGEVDGAPWKSMRGGGVRYAYYDTVPLPGFLIETLNPGGKA